MIESGLGVIAACLPTLHKLIAPSSIRSVLSSVRSALSLDSFRSHSSVSSRPFKEETDYGTKGATDLSKPSHRERFEMLENMKDVYGVSDLEGGLQIPLSPKMPRRVHMQSAPSVVKLKQGLLDV